MIKNIIILIAFLPVATSVFAQRDRLDFIRDSIVNEGKALYRSEWASWYGTDIFLAKCPDKKSLSGGYLSYETADGLINIFFSKGDTPNVFATISFGKDFDSKNYKLDTSTRKFTPVENELFTIRSAAKKRAFSDTAFKRYKNTGINFVPIIQKDVKKVYILTSPEMNDIVILGNDYLINFDDRNQVTAFKKLHKDTQFLSTKADSGKTAEVAMHTHLPESGDFITASDICILMLYEKFTPWKQHYVISKNDVSIWDCKKNELFILTMDAWKRIQADQETRHPKKE